MPAPRPLFFFALAPLLLLVGGCAHPAFYDSSRTGPFFAPANVSAAPTLAGLRRVVVLPVASETVAPPESAADLDSVIRTALQHENRFEVVALSRDECRARFHTEALSSAAALPRDLLPTLQREFAADGVLFVDLTVYDAYRPLAIGWRAKLATIDGTRLLWSFDNVFAADNPAVANSARHYFLQRDTGGVPADLTPAVLQSPGRFAAYAAAAMFDTLPPVTAPVLPESSAARRATR
ncbi:MAG TPA: hypothetical protein VHD62_02970 [Opitutaceae bacterium]|nr:hypothetical protein [Opitutaceae bacterium]